MERGRRHVVLRPDLPAADPVRAAGWRRGGAPAAPGGGLAAAAAVVRAGGGPREVAHALGRPARRPVADPGPRRPVARQRPRRRHPPFPGRRRDLGADHRPGCRRPPGARASRPRRPGGGRDRVRARRDRGRRRHLAVRARRPARRLLQGCGDLRRPGPGQRLDRPVRKAGRPVSNIDTGCLVAAGPVAAFGTAAGSVHLSQDAGASWEQVAADLPPVRSMLLGAG